MNELADVQLENDPIYWEMVFNFGRKLYYLNDPVVKANWKTTYQSYLRSKPWQEKADIAKKRAGYRCQLCNSNGEIHVHHRTYERLGNEWQSDLIVLCSKCHAKFHEMEY